MKRLLFITRHYLSDNNGGANATKGFVHAFAQLFDDLTLIYPEHDDQDNSHYVPSSCKCIPCFDKRSRIQKGLDVYRGRLHRFTDFVRGHLVCNRYDVIVLDHSLTAASIIDYVVATGAKIITIHHNVEGNYLKDNLPPLLYRYPMVYYSVKAERDALLKSDVNLTLTQNDADEFASWYVGRNLHLHSIGICEYKSLPEKTFRKKSGGNTFIITGSLCFRQSYEPIVNFVSTYYNKLIERCPECKLIIAGRNPGREITDICSGKDNIQLIGNPEDMGTLLETADYYICPINAGSGIKLRVTDGLKYGLPILCHNVSAIGYEAFVEKSQIFRYNDEQSFVESLDKMLMTDNNPNEVYESFRDYFSPDTLACKIRNILIEE